MERNCQDLSTRISVPHSRPNRSQVWFPVRANSSGIFPRNEGGGFSNLFSSVCMDAHTCVCECGVWLCASYVIYPLKKSYFIYYIYLKKYRTQIFVAMVAKEDLEVFIFICYSWFYLCLILLVSESMGKNPVRAARTERCVRNPARCAPCAIGRPQVRCRPPLCKRDTVARSAMQQAGHGRRIKRSTGQGQWQHGGVRKRAPCARRAPHFFPSMDQADKPTYILLI